MTDRYVPIPIILLYILFWWGAGVLMFIVLTDNAAPTAPQLAWKDLEPKTNTKIEVQLERESVGWRPSRRPASQPRPEKKLEGRRFGHRRQGHTHKKARAVGLRGHAPSAR